MGARYKTPYDRVKATGNLWRAWHHVRDRGSKSISRETRDEIKEFDRESNRKIRAIYEKLHARKFVFEPAQPVLKRRAGRSPRPIVIAPVPSRVVQRSILDALVAAEAMKPFREVQTSFGMRGVPEAIEVAYRTSTQDGKYYIRSDIESFFTNIPRANPCSVVAEKMCDADLAKLLEDATCVDLLNANSMGHDLDYFPDDEFGVAQGCALSTLMGDVLLYEFDRQMNDRGIVCLRYVDDFLILGPNQSRVIRAFEHGQELLSKLNLRAYDPRTAPEKACSGWTDRPWEFLGCEILPGIIRPTRKAKRRLLEEIDWRIEEGIGAMGSAAMLSGDTRRSFAQTIDEVHRLVRGWGNQYSFCNDDSFGDLDAKIWKKIERYRKASRERELRCVTDLECQCLLGVQPLTLCNKDPIVVRIHRRAS